MFITDGNIELFITDGNIELFKGIGRDGMMGEGEPLYEIGGMRLGYAIENFNRVNTRFFYLLLFIHKVIITAIF